MTEQPAYSEQIATNLTVLLGILSAATQIIETGLEAAKSGQPGIAVGSILPADPLLGDAGTLLKAMLILHGKARGGDQA